MLSAHYSILITRYLEFNIWGLNTHNLWTDVREFQQLLEFRQPPQHLTVALGFSLPEEKVPEWVYGVKVGSRNA